MKFKTLLFLALLVIISSCTKVVDVDLNENDPKIVVDGYIKYEPINNRLFASVKLSKTTSYFDNTVPKPITDATLSLINGNGKEIPLIYSDYHGFNADIDDANHNDTWTLKGIIENSDIKAETTIPNFVKIDSINAFKLPFGPLKDGYTPVVFFTDIPGESNHYRLKIHLNSALYKGLYLLNDEGQDGKQIAYPFFKVNALIGDEIQIELITINEFSYEYFKVFSLNLSGGGFSTAPGNPHSNIEGQDMIGIFTGSTIYTAKRVIGD